MPTSLRRWLSPSVNAAQSLFLGRHSHTPRASLDEIAPGPLIVSGFFGDILGLGSAARSTVYGLTRAGLPVRTHDIGFIRSLPIYGRAQFPSADPGGVWIAHCNPPELERLLGAFGDGPLKTRYRIGYWAWELDILPSEWARLAPTLHEIWTPSNFVADTVRRAIAATGERQTIVRMMPHPLPDDLKQVHPDRRRFGLPQGCFIVLSMMDLRSSRVRKNADASLAAYLGAFPEPTGGACLVLKIVAPDFSPEQLSELVALAGGRPDIRFITEHLKDEETWSLVASADVLLSLHRSEGYGLVLAEAMRLGTPVIATGWSGNMDFMDETTAALVDYAMTPVHDPQGQYARRSGSWADPDVGAAVRWLQQLAVSPDLRKQMARAAKARIERHEETFGVGIAGMPWLSKVTA